MSRPDTDFHQFFQDIRSSKGSGSSASKGGPMSAEDAQQMLDNRLSKIIEFGEPGAARKAIKESKRKGSKGNILTRTLGLIGKPLSIVASTAKESIDFVQGEGFSGKDWLNQGVAGWDSHYGFGNILEEETNLPMWAKRAGGFIGDVAFDPLTYLAPEAKLERLGARGVAKELSVQGLEDAAARVLRSGISSLTDEELARIGARGGLHLNIPGTGRLARAVTRSEAGEARQLRLLGRGRATTGVARTIHGGTKAVRGTRTASRIREVLGGDRFAAREALKSGDPSKAMDALKMLDTDNVWRLRERGFEQKQGSVLHDLLTEAKSKNVVGQDIHYGAAGNADRAERVVAALGEEKGRRLLGLYDEWLKEANLEVGASALDGSDVFRSVDDYAARYASDEAVEAGVLKTAGSGTGASYKQAPMERMRKYVSDAEASVKEGRSSEFLNKPLRKPAEAGVSIEEQMNAIASEVYGDDAVKMFADDAYEVLPRYLRNLTRQVGKRGREHELLRKGVAEPRWLKTEVESSLHKVAAKNFMMKRLENALADRRLAAARLEVSNRAKAAEGAKVADARGAAQKAGEAIGTPAPNADAIEAMREYARWHEEGALSVREGSDDAVGRLRAEADDLRAQGAPGAAEKAAEADAAEYARYQAHLQVQESSLRLNRLEAERSRLETKVARAESHMSRRIDAAKERQALEALKDEIEQAHVELLDQAAAAGRTPDIVLLQRRAVRDTVAQLRREEDVLEAVVANARHPYVGDAQSSGVHVMDDAGRADRAEVFQASSKSAYDEAREFMERAGFGRAGLPKVEARLKAVRDEIDRGDMFLMRLNREYRAFSSTMERDVAQYDAWNAALPDADRTADEFVDLDEALGEQPDAMTNPWSNQPLHFHGTSHNFDATTPPSQRMTSTSDARIGPNLAGRGETAENFGATVVEVQFHAENPKRFGEGVEPAPESDAAMSAFGEPSYDDDIALQERVDLTGSEHGPGKREFMNDIFRVGWNEGTITPELLAESAADPTVADAWRQVRSLTDDGDDIEDAVYAVFSRDPEISGMLDRFDGHVGNDLSEADLADLAAVGGTPTASAPTWAVEDEAERVFTRVVYEVNNPHRTMFGGLADADWDDVAETYRAHLAGEGFDSVMYPMMDDFTVVAIDPLQIETTGAEKMFGPQVSVWDYWKQRHALEQKLQEPVRNAARDVQQVDAAIRATASTASEAKIIKATNERRVAELRRELSQGEQQVEAKARRVAARADTLEQQGRTAEFALRQRAATLYVDASTLEEEHAMLTRAALTDANAAAAAAEAAAKVQIVHLEAAAQVAAADLLKADHRVDQWGEWTKRLADAKVEYKVRDMLREGMREFGPATQAPEFVVEALTAATRMNTPEGLQGFVKMWDGFTSTFKGLATLTPGFHSRNAMGGVFNNWLHGVEHGAHRRFATAYTKWSAGKATGLSGKAEEAFQEIARSGLLTGGQTVAEIEGRVGQIGGSLNPVKWSRSAGGHVENVLRGTLAMDTLVKGGTIEDAISNVFKYHFDYEDLSSFERSVMRRLVPFYTWTRKNVPLMMEEIVRKPGKFNRYLISKRNIELGTDDESVVPSYFGEQLGIRLPFKVGGSQAYVLPDLPFRDLARTFDPGQLLSQVNPLVKAPLEIKSGKQFFSDVPIKRGFTEVPASLRAVPGVMPALKAAHKVRVGANGKTMIRQTDLYLIEQAMPLFGRARRLFPSEEKYASRVATTWAGFLFGANVRVNTETDQRNELLRRLDTLDQQWADQKALGDVTEEEAATRTGGGGNNAIDGLFAELGAM